MSAPAATLADERLTERLRTRVAPSLKQAVLERAARTGRSEGAVVRAALKAYLRREIA